MYNISFLLDYIKLSHLTKEELSKIINVDILSIDNYLNGELEKDIKDVIHVSIGLKNNNFISEYYKIFKDKYPDLKISIMQDSFGEKRWLEITQKNIEKYKGINQIAKIENIPNENIIAFGDGLNDLDMLAKCGIGVAMKNALPEVKKVAKFTTNKANYENGIIDFLENINKSAEV